MGQWWTLGKLVQIIAILPCSNMRHIIKTGEHTLIHKHHHSKNIGTLPCIQIVQYVFRVFSYVPIFLWVFVYFPMPFPGFSPWMLRPARYHRHWRPRCTRPHWLREMPWRRHGGNTRPDGAGCPIIMGTWYIWCMHYDAQTYVKFACIYSI